MPSPTPAMPEDPSAAAEPAAQLTALRVEIDRIDAAMHALLIDRSTIIDRLIAIKQRQGGGSAFRPGREAEMMRRIAERHRGRLPLDTVENIWRVIIATFTYAQASYAVHAAVTNGEAAMRDSARFHFGFTVPLQIHATAEAAIAAVAEAEGDLGLLPVGGSTEHAWWTGLMPSDAPKIIARLPFVERPEHPAGLPVFVVARPFAAAASRDVVLYALAGALDATALSAVLDGLGGEIVGTAAGSAAAPSMIVAVPGAVAGSDLDVALTPLVGPGAATVIGSHAARFTWNG